MTSTPHIDFYLLETADPLAGEQWVCRLLQKIYLQKRQVYIYTASAAETQRLDQILWTFQDESFLPHAIADTTQALFAPIQLGHTSPPPACNDVLLNISGQFPDFYMNFQRILEVVINQTDVRAQARARYPRYKQSGGTLETHRIP